METGPEAFEPQSCICPLLLSLFSPLSSLSLSLFCSLRHVRGSASAVPRSAVVRADVHRGTATALNHRCVRVCVPCLYLFVRLYLEACVYVYVCVCVCVCVCVRVCASVQAFASVLKAKE